MRQSVPPAGPGDEPLDVLGEVSAPTNEDPFGPGDPVEVARLVRRALSVAGRHATDVAALVVVARRDVAPEGLARFTRRALGPHGANIPSFHEWDDPSFLEWDDPSTGRDVWSTIAEQVDLAGRSVVILVLLGPGESATVRCLGSPRGTWAE
jgi:hypothetical protein